jgi:hypothetical protein
MLRKTMLIIAAAATIGSAVVLSSTDASARWGGRGWGGSHVAFRGGGVGFARAGWGWRGARVGWRGAGWGWRGAGWGWRGGGWGWRTAGWGWGWRRPWLWGGIGLIGAPIYASAWDYPIYASTWSCWRWQPTAWGPTRVWVC